MSIIEELRDPVCGMKVERGDALEATHEGETYYFCSSECKDKFEREPEHYARRIA